MEHDGNNIQITINMFQYLNISNYRDFSFLGSYFLYKKFSEEQVIFDLSQMR